ncbi:hypothetical protein Z517_07519 [Fonsecaea pedrosoi CBS 271.37]|uniref:NACHT domain-containing protein n=1 Tax=Fonsecaea pedrosoi CBS 271.37 TaxID=1442368 RepID=A0A0D2DJ50_9EURO|nr:uncharacterized protein Z517_07519 [Fonsecaea pedrosoi CBS 271.37]KIW77686.1 hypothetical protein Z517_07519 [Fonsecaea pedrosoi CBS 271.37]
MKSDHIEALKRKLDECARVLDSTILVHLSQNLGTLAAQQTNVLDQLNDWQRKIYSEIVAGNTRIDSLIKTTAEDVKAHTMLEHNITRRATSTENSTILSMPGQLRQTLIASWKRQDTIDDAHRKTFEWIFDSTAHTKCPWDNFMLWTQDDNPIYWILGKAGSGKSTLMNFVVQDERTREAFKRVDLQKNQVGLLRSIIWQILKLVDVSTSVQIWSTMLQKISPPLPTVWTQKQLRRILQSLVQMICDPICLFLGGLDEFQGVEDHFEAIGDIIGVFRDRQKTKICIASRPSACLDSLYKTSPHLRLQDLTMSDITRYVEDKLTRTLSSDSYRWLATSASMEMHELIREVVLRAQGVFFWVRLTVESLVRGIQKDDDWRILARRLEQMPQGIFHLYEHMWKRMEADHPLYAREAAAYLQYVQERPFCSLIELTMACDESLQESYLDKLATCDLRTLGQELNAETSKKRILTRCAGFLEIHGSIDENEKDRSLLVRLWGVEDGDTDLIHYPETMKRLVEINKSHRRLYVSFLHRTAREYLETESGKKLLQAQPPMHHELVMMRYKSTLVTILLGAIWVNRHTVNPNQKSFIDPADGDTTGYSTIWTYSVLNMSPESLERTTRAFIEAGADLNTWIQLPLYSAGKYHPVWDRLRRIRDYDQSFVLLRIKARDILLYKNVFLEADLLHKAGSATVGPFLVIFEPPNAWRTVALDPSVKTVQDKFMRGFWQDQPMQDATN